MWRLLACVVSLWGLPMAAGAAIYTYEYQGEPFYCGGPENRIPVGSPGFGCHNGNILNSPFGPDSSIPGWTSTITIDERHLPGRSIRNAGISVTAYIDQKIDLFNWYGEDSGDSDVTWIMDIRTPQGRKIAWGASDESDEASGVWVTDFGAMRIEGDLKIFVSPYGVMTNGFGIRFGSDASVLSSGGWFADGGSPDLNHNARGFDVLYGGGTCGSYDRGDGVIYSEDVCGYSGTWRLVSVAPAPVPLPASAVGLLIAVGALAGLGWRRTVGAAR